MPRTQSWCRIPMLLAVLDAAFLLAWRGGLPRRGFFARGRFARSFRPADSFLFTRSFAPCRIELILSRQLQHAKFRTGCGDAGGIRHVAHRVAELPGERNPLLRHY